MAEREHGNGGMRDLKGGTVGKCERKGHGTVAGDQQ